MNTLVYTGQNNIQSNTLNANMFDDYINFLDASPATIDTYTKALKQFIYYLQDEEIRQPQRQDIINYRDRLKENLKPSTVQSYITAVKLFFKWTAVQGHYPNVADHIKGAKINRDHKKDYLTSNQIKHILGSMETNTAKGKRDYAIITLITIGGLRTIEVIRADVGDIRVLGGNTVLYIQGKGREEKSEYIKIQERTEIIIREYLKTRGKASDKDPLFTSVSNKNSGERLTTRSIRRIIKDRFKAAGYDSDRLTAHSLRHTAVTLSLLAGKDITEVQQFARHKNISTTMIYNHALDKAKNSCSAAIEEALF